MACGHAHQLVLESEPLRHRAWPQHPVHHGKAQMNRSISCSSNEHVHLMPPERVDAVILKPRVAGHQRVLHSAREGTEQRAVSKGGLKGWTMAQAGGQVRRGSVGAAATQAAQTQAIKRHQ